MLAPHCCPDRQRAFTSCIADLTTDQSVCISRFDGLALGEMKKTHQKLRNRNPQTAGCFKAKFARSRTCRRLRGLTILSKPTESKVLPLRWHALRLPNGTWTPIDATSVERVVVGAKIVAVQTRDQVIKVAMKPADLMRQLWPHKPPVSRLDLEFFKDVRVMRWNESG